MSSTQKRNQSTTQLSANIPTELTEKNVRAMSGKERGWQVISYDDEDTWSVLGHDEAEMVSVKDEEEYGIDVFVVSVDQGKVQTDFQSDATTTKVVKLTAEGNGSNSSADDLNFLEALEALENAFENGKALEDHVRAIEALENAFENEKAFQALESAFDCAFGQAKTEE